MPESERLRLTRDTYRAFELRDRTTLDAAFSDDFTFISGTYPGGLDRDGFFEHVWPNVDGLTQYRFVRLEEISGDQVLVTYESTGPDGSRYWGTEIFTFTGDRMSHAEAYSGWTLQAKGAPESDS
jgi:hypothetical protein